MIKVILLILLAEIWGTSGHILYKISTNSIETPNLRNRTSYLNFIRKIISMPTIWLGFGLIIVGLVIWLFALAQANLTKAFPIDSMQYILLLFAAHFFLGEKINKLKLTGTFLVIVGIIIVAIS